MNKLTIFLALGLGMMFFSGFVMLTKHISQQRMVLDSNPNFTVTGTSTLHDWEMKSTSARGEGKVEMENQRISSVSDLVITIPSKSLEASRSTMTNNAHKAMKADQHSTITYRLTEVVSSRPGGQGVILQTRGTLTLAGVTKTISMPVEARVQGNKAHFSGSYKLKMSDYNIEVPSMMMGTLRTGDDVTVNFQVQFNL